MAKITISEVQNVPTHYGKKTRALVTLDHFSSDDFDLYNQKAYFYCKDFDEIKSNHIESSGSLTQFAPHTYLFRAKEIKNLPSTFSLMKKRGELKKRLYQKLHHKMQSHFSADLIYALLSGEVVNMQLRMLFNRLGLGHLLAISGFHFSIVTGFLALFFVRSNRRLALITLISFATLYFLFVGGFASIKRAYLMLLVVLVGHFFSLRSSSINTLGSCLLILLIIDPILTLSLGFQLSFLATASILLYYSTVNNWLKKLLPSRSPREAKELSYISLSGYLFVSLFRKALAINLSVYILCLPYLLYLFHSFPFLSLYYNLFMPLLIASILIGGGLALLIDPFFPILSQYSDYILSLLVHFPRYLDFSITIYSMSKELLFVLLVPLVVLGFYICQKQRDKALNSSQIIHN
ncbi:MAG: ComEC/Rec2 family competence protein [Rhabdochlamydiaceae bacterium]|nr:ComEC/Rec2 family competence protein [Candidatus Amphrikana amoebophyrae]